MSKYIIKQNLEKGAFKKNKILELGSGTGLMSIVLANLGNEVYATDTKESMRLLEENIEENQKNFEKIGTITPFILDWNFERQKLKDTFIEKKVLKLDYILSSDVIVSEKDVEIFLDTLINIDSVLKDLNNNVSLNYNIIMGLREREDVSLDGFLGEAENKGFRFNRIDAHDLDPDYTSSDVHFFVLEFDDVTKD